MSGFTSLSVGVNALNAAQTGINNTSNNITNAYTKGYVRRLTIFSDYTYNQIGSIDNLQQIGRGVFVSETSRVRDILADKAYREQSAREGFYSSLYKVTGEIETILGELEGVAFQDELENIWYAVSELKKDPESSVAKTELTMAGESFIVAAKNAYAAMARYQSTLNTEIISQINKINSLGDQILQYNLKIQGIEGAHIEDANNLRDERDNLLDELSNLINITYSEDASGYVTVLAEGIPFITEGNVFHMEGKLLNVGDDSDFVTPVWPHVGFNDGRVFNLLEEISTANKNDMGSLKGLLLARGDYSTDYTDIPKAKDFITDTYKDGYENPAYKEAVKEYNNHTNQSTVMKAMAYFDNLVTGITERINDALSPARDELLNINNTAANVKAANFASLSAAENAKWQVFDLGTDLGTPPESITIGGVEYKVVLSNSESDKVLNYNNTDKSDYNYQNMNVIFYLTDIGKFAASREEVKSGVTGSISCGYKALDTENCAVGADGKFPPQEFFVRDNTTRYKEITVDGKTEYIFNRLNEAGHESLYNVNNVSVNTKILDDCTLIPMTTQNGYADQARADALAAAWEADFENLDPNFVTPKTFDGYYNEMIYQIGNDGTFYKSMSENQQTTVTELDESRQEQNAVSTDEELAYLIKFQGAYNAASRYITVVDRMIEILAGLI